MDERIFGKFCRAALRPAEKRRLLEALRDRRRARRFAAFVQEWSLLAGLTLEFEGRRRNPAEPEGDLGR